ELERGHFKREERHGAIEIQRRVLRQRERERRLTHTGPRGDDDEVGLLESVGVLVEFGESGRNTRNPLLLAGERFQLLLGLHGEVAEARIAPVEVLLRNVEEVAFRLVEQLEDVLRVLERIRDRARADPDE